MRTFYIPYLSTYLLTFWVMKYKTGPSNGSLTIIFRFKIFVYLHIMLEICMYVLWVLTNPFRPWYFGLIDDWCIWRHEFGLETDLQVKTDTGNYYLYTYVLILWSNTKLSTVQEAIRPSVNTYINWRWDVKHKGNGACQNSWFALFPGTTSIVSD